MDIIEQLKRLQAGKLGPYPDREIWSQAIAEIEHLRATLKSIAEYCRDNNATPCLVAVRNTAEQALRAHEQSTPATVNDTDRLAAAADKQGVTEEK